MKKILEINDLKMIAKKNLPKMFYDYVDSGSYTESTYRDNENDFNKIKIRQRVGRDISSSKLEKTILGKKYKLPFGFSPCGMGGMLYPDGEILVAKACEENNIPYILSTMSICSIEQVAKETNNPFWFQLYVMKDKNFVENIIKRASDAKCYALVLTLDLPILAQRHKDIRNELSAPPRLTLNNILQIIQKPKWCFKMLSTSNRSFGNILGHVKGVDDLSSIVKWTDGQFDAGLSWDYVKWIRRLWKGPLILKGILDEGDVKIANNLDIQGIIISNHGGRQLDGTLSSIMALKNLKNKVNSNIEIFFDGGVRSGKDIVKALSLGAKGIFMGRPYLYGLGAFGQKGVEKVIEILIKELNTTLLLAGETDVNNLDQDNLY
ncbi:MAG: alpha-hydroxy-acid oxidizing enzyme [Alphaproteobacteria bacterium TMED62]|nr:MAG: alpha-hydroxy-acid oxidizing enzyme [Alphaproteobacteria bacterium TMED62]|tara:strand:- start:11328 stop:12461 length:1134 start_codon:yes stop_codon:yes gene_type:complete